MSFLSSSLSSKSPSHSSSSSSIIHVSRRRKRINHHWPSTISSSSSVSSSSSSSASFPSSSSICKSTPSMTSILLIALTLLWLTLYTPITAAPGGVVSFQQQQFRHQNNDDLHDNDENHLHHVESSKIFDTNIRSKTINLRRDAIDDAIDVDVHHSKDDKDANNSIKMKPLSSSKNEKEETNPIWLYTDPIDVQVNVEETAQFEVYLTAPPQKSIEVQFHCSSSVCSTFEADQLPPITLTPTNYHVWVNFTVHSAGHDLIELKLFNNTGPQQQRQVIDVTQAFVRVRVGHSNFLTILGTTFGWIYFLSWSISFWPQNITNYKRKSVVGLSLDYTLLHFTGFIFYSIFNCALYWSALVQEEYEDKFPRSEIPVELNDVVYSLHAAAVTSITWTQCFIYDRGTQTVALYSKLFQLFVWIGGTILAILAILHTVTWLTFIYYFSYIKLVVTGVKYLPQLIFNFRRKSTAGWSIYMIYLDITGGSMSMLQMLTIAYNYNDWKTLVGNLPKLGLSLASIFYDILFLLQEFVFFPNSSPVVGGVVGVLGGSRRSTLKDAGDSHDQLCSMNSSTSSIDSAISTTKNVDDSTSSTSSTSSSTGVKIGEDQTSKSTKINNLNGIDLNSHLSVIKRNSETFGSK